MAGKARPFSDFHNSELVATKQPLAQGPRHRLSVAGWRLRTVRRRPLHELRRRPHEVLLADLAAMVGDPLAPDVPLDREHAGLVVQLLGHVFADALHGLAAAAGGVRRFVVNLAPRQVRRQHLSLGLLLVFGGRLLRLLRLDLGGQRGTIGPTEKPKSKTHPRLAGVRSATGSYGSFL